MQDLRVEYHPYLRVPRIVGQGPSSIFLSEGHIFWTKSGKKPPTEVVAAQMPLLQLLRQLLLEALDLLQVCSVLVLGHSLLSTRQGQRMGNLPLLADFKRVSN